MREWYPHLMRNLEIHLMENDMSRKANRKINREFKTAEGCIVTTNGSEITLETRKAPVIGRIGVADLSWLMADCLSTANGYRS